MTAPARMAGEERGFALMELLVTMGVLMLALVATVATFDHTSKLSTVSEKKEAAAHIGEQTLEQAQSLPYSSLAMSSAPSPSGSPPDPLSYVTDCGGSRCYQWNQRGPTASGASEPFVIANASDPKALTGGADLTPLTPWQKRWDDGRFRGTLYRFVTWTSDPSSSSSKRKRITVEVTVDGPGLRKPLVLSTMASDST